MLFLLRLICSTTIREHALCNAKKEEPHTQSKLPIEWWEEARKKRSRLSSTFEISKQIRVDNE